MRKFANSLNADYPRAIFIEKVSQYAKAFWLKQRLFGVFVTNCCVCCKFATNDVAFPLKALIGLVYERVYTIFVGAQFIARTLVSIRSTALISLAAMAFGQ